MFTYKTNKYILPLLDVVGVTPTRITFFVAFAYLEREQLNNVVWALQRFQGLFLRRDALPRVIVTDRDLALMNAVKVVFLEATNLLCWFHIDKNVKANLMSALRILKFLAWPIFVDYVNQTWLIPHKEIFVKVWRNKVMHLGNTVTNRYKNSKFCCCEETDELNSMCAPPKKVKTKGAQKKPMTKQQRSTKCDPSYWEYIDALHSVQNSNSSIKRSASSSEQPIQRRTMPMLDQFHPCIHDSIINIVDVKAYGIGLEDSWSLVCNHLLKELTKWSDEYINLVGGIDRFEELKRSLLVDGLSMMNITDMGYVIASRYNVILVSLSLQQSMTFILRLSNLSNLSAIAWQVS
ncbi:hypothetical protein HKD37_16G045296 [Glycine soja]